MALVIKMRLHNLKILVFDLEAFVAEDLRHIIDAEGGVPLVAASSQMAINILSKVDGIACAVVHHSTIGRDGVDVRHELRRRNIPFVTYSLTTFLDPQEFGAVLPRPSSSAVIVETIVQSLAR